MESNTDAVTIVTLLIFALLAFSFNLWLMSVALGAFGVSVSFWELVAITGLFSSLTTSVPRS